MLLDALHPFSAAVKALDVKEILPTDMTSADLRLVDAGIKRQSFFSAQTLLTDLLDGYKEKIASIVNPVTTQRADHVTEENPLGNVTTGLNDAQARTEIKQLLQSLGYSPAAEDRGTLKDLSSNARINLVIRTNTQLAQGAGHFIQQNDPDVVNAFPALELVRFEERNVPRDWEQRWREAARASGDLKAYAALADGGRMVALKNSPIWDSLGDSDLFADGLDNPYPPFAFNSGMWTQDVSYDEAVELGLLADGETPEANPLDLANLFSAD